MNLSILFLEISESSTKQLVTKTVKVQHFLQQWNAEESVE